MADIAQLTTLVYDGTTVSKITSISGPSISNPIIDVSDLDDTAREKISSALVDSGQLTLGLNFEADNTSHDFILDEINAGNSGTAVIEFQNGTDTTTTWSFTAFPTELTPTANSGEQLTASVTLEVSGAVTAA